MARVAAVAWGWLVLMAAPDARANTDRQSVVVDCGEHCDAVAASLARMGGDVSRRAGRLAVQIATDRLPEIPMLRGVSAAAKEGPDVTHGPAHLVGPGRGVALETGSPGLVRTSGAGDRPDGVLRSADPPATASGTVAQNDLVPVLVQVPAGTRELSFALLWDEAGSDDVDLIVLAPDGSALGAGATLRNPERAVVTNPAPGVWTAFVNGFAMNGRADRWQLGVTADGVPLPPL